MNSRATLWLLLLLGILTFFVISSRLRLTAQPSVQPPTKAVPPTATPEPTGVELGDIASDFRLPSLNLHEVRLSDHRGHKVLLNFFSSWCVPCREEMPGVQRLYEKYHDQNWEFIGIAVVDLTDDVIEFRDEFGLTFIIGLDMVGHTTLSYAVQGTPTNITIDTNGRIVDRQLGYMSEDDLKAMLEAVP